MNAQWIARQSPVPLLPAALTSPALHAAGPSVCMTWPQAGSRRARPTLSQRPWRPAPPVTPLARPPVGSRQRSDVEQIGHALEAFSAQSRHGHEAFIVQHGAYHQRLIVQSGADDQARIEQDGAHNDALIEQTGTGHSSRVTQHGQGLSVRVRLYH